MRRPFKLDTVQPVMRRALAYWKANTYSGSGNWLDKTRNGFDLVNSGASFLDYVATKYLRLPGTAGNYCSAPDSAALSITGDIDFRCAIAPDAVTAAETMIAKFTTTGNQRSYRFYKTVDGFLGIETSALGTTAVASESDTGVANNPGALIAVRGTLDVDNGAVGKDYKFYTKATTEATAAADCASDTGWSQLGSTITTAVATSIFDSTAVLELGSSQVGTATPFAGKMYAAVIKNGINGTTAFSADFNTATEPFATFTEGANSATVTINRTATGVKSCMVDRDLWLFGTEDSMSVAHSRRLNPTAPLTVVAVCRVYGTPAADSVIVAKKASAGSAAGWRLVWSGTRVPNFEVGDGTTSASDTSGAVSAGTLTTIQARRRRRSKLLDATLAEVGNGRTADTTASVISNTTDLTVGALGGADFADMELVALGIWSEDLSDNDLAHVRRELTA